MSFIFNLADDCPGLRYSEMGLPGTSGVLAGPSSDAICLEDQPMSIGKSWVLSFGPTPGMGSAACRTL